MVGSTVLNSKLIKWGLHRTLAFVLTVWTFACLNFFILKFLHTIGGEPSQVGDSTTMTTPVALRTVARGSRRMTTTQPTTLLKPMRGGGGTCAFSTIVRGTASGIHDFVCSVGEPVKLHDS